MQLRWKTGYKYKERALNKKLLSRAPSPKLDALSPFDKMSRGCMRQGVGLVRVISFSPCVN